MEEAKLGKEDIVELAKGVGFLGEECWVTSGAALVLYGVKERTRDVDLVCTTSVADRLEGQGGPFRRSPLGGTRIFALGEQVEILENWSTDRVDMLGGLPVASLASIRRQKEALGREKDRTDIGLIDGFLKRYIRLETERLVLRDYVPADEEDYYRLKTDPETMGRYMRDIMLHSREEAREEFAGVLADAAKGPERKFYFLRAELKGSGSQVGSVGYTVEDATPVGRLVHAGYFYLPAFWGQGYGTEAFRRVVDFAFTEGGVYRLTTGCLEENQGSRRVMEKCGLIQEARRPDWEWHDGQMKTRLEYRLLKREYRP